MGYTIGVALRRIQLWALWVVVLLNSGGMGYWVCHDEVRSGSFWLRGCSEDVEFALHAIAPTTPPTTPALNLRSCDCEFVAVTAPVPPRGNYDAPQAWHDVPLLQTSYDFATMLCMNLPTPRIHAPPPKSSPLRLTLWRAPPTA